MKMPQRRFVVEYKANRRQSRSNANSIWGDTDFKALAREVEDEESHLFVPKVDVAPRSDEPTVPRPRILEALSQIPAAEPVTVVAEPALETHNLSEEPVGGNSVIEPEALPQSSEPVLETLREISSPPRTAQRTRKPRAVTVEETASEHSREIMLTLPEELAALDAENKRLKRLWAARLRQENLQLGRMLARFDSTFGAHFAS